MISQQELRCLRHEWSMVHWRIPAVLGSLFFLAVTVADGAGCSTAPRCAADDPCALPDGGAALPDASGPIAATMNDVSVLFPLPATEADVGNLLAPSAAGTQGTLVPGALYASLGSTPGADGGPQLVGPYSGLRVVAMRIDPCFASLDPNPRGVGCTAQIRLIFQQVAWQPGGASASDAALHAFYDLSRDDFLALARALVDLRLANAVGAPTGGLAPNPIMASQGLGGPMSQGVEALILQYAGEKNLVRLAQFAALINELEAIWTMSAFDVGNGATIATPSAIATIPVDGGAFVEGIGGSADRPGPDGGPAFLSVRFGPTTSPDNFSALDDGHPGSLAATALQAAFDGLVQVENPKDNSPNTIDCASCHLATPTEILVAKPLFGLDDTTSPLAFQPDGVHVTAGDMAPTFGINGGDFNIHAFSYFGASPGINQRVVNETAAVVEYLNDLPE
jgi:hypothetical protein